MHTRFDTEARIAVAQATDLARELGHTQVGPDHVLLGLLANMRGSAYAALTDHGVRLDAARDIVAAHHLDPVDDHTDEPADHADSADIDHEAPDRSDLDEDREALRAIGIDLDRVREAVRDNLGQDLTAGWGSRPERRGRGRGRGRRPERGHRERGHHGRGRRGPRSRRLDGPAFSPALRGLLRDVRRATLRARLDEDADARRHAPGMTGQRLLLALLGSDDAVVRAVLATASDPDGLRARVEADTVGTPTT